MTRTSKSLEDGGHEWTSFQGRYDHFIPRFNEFKACLLTDAPIYLRPNSKHLSRDELQSYIQQYYPDATVKVPFVSLPLLQVDGIRKQWGGALEHHQGLYFIQALSSLLPVMALDLAGDESVLDMCAAPGGKTTHLSELLREGGFVVANEPDIGRARILKANLDRMACHNTLVTNSWGQDIKVKPGSFDAILLDGPCSSEGTLRGKTVKSRYTTYNEDFRKKLHQTQFALMKQAYHLLKPGGTLVYSTCTYDWQENEEIVAQALDHFAHLQLVELPPSLLELPLVDGDSTKNETLCLTKRVYPHYLNSTGFYVAKFIKRT